MFQGMTIAEQRVLVALIALIALGLGYGAYEDRQRQEAVYIERGERPAATPSLPSTEAGAQAPIVPPTAAPPPAPSPPSRPDLVDINRATLEELDTLPGIGPVKGQAILDYRSQAGRFHAIDELVNVKGIGEKTLETLRPLVCVGP
jgi:competence ComEA-like helix-hairpin-helix protein